MTDNVRVRDKRGGNRHFVDNVIIDHYGKQLGPYGIAVYVTLCRFANADDQDCYPSLQTIAKLTGMSKPTVVSRLKQLQELDLIDCKGRVRENGGQTSNLYLLLAPPVKEIDRGGKSPSQGAVKEVDTNNTHVEQNSSTNDPKGAQAPELPRNLNDWILFIKLGKGEPGGMIGRLGRMFVTLYPDYKVDYGRIGKAAKRVGGARRLAHLCWLSQGYRVTGDPVDYCEGMHNGKEKKTNGTNRSNGKGSRPLTASEQRWKERVEERRRDGTL